MADDKVEEAIEIIARQAVADSAERNSPEWEEYPLIGANHWERIESRWAAIAGALYPGREAFEAAYEFLSERAEHGD